MTLTEEELLAIMKGNSNKKEDTETSKESEPEEIKIPKTHEPEMPHRVLTQTKESIPRIVEAASKSESKLKARLTGEDVSGILQSINGQLVRTNELLLQLRNAMLNQPSSYRIPEDEVILNGE